MQQLEAEAKNTEQTSQNNSKPPTNLGDDLGVAAIFLALGLILHFFALDTNTPSWDGFYQLLSYLSYAISFFGAAYGMEKHSKKGAYVHIGLGVMFGIVAYWIHTEVIKLRNTSTIWAILVELVFMGCVALTAFGLVKGFTHIFINPQQETSAQAETTYELENSKKGRWVGYILALLSLLFGFIQALPIIIEYVKTILHLL